MPAGSAFWWWFTTAAPVITVVALRLQRIEPGNKGTARAAVLAAVHHATAVAFMKKRWRRRARRAGSALVRGRKKVCAQVRQ